jgi:hypothetical protein
MHNKSYGLALLNYGWVEGHVGRDLSLKGRAKRLSDCSLAYTDKQFAFCELFQKNLWESVNCACSIKVSVESLNVILLRNVDGQSVCQ